MSPSKELATTVGVVALVLAMIALAVPHCPRSVAALSGLSGAHLARLDVSTGVTVRPHTQVAANAVDRAPGVCHRADVLLSEDLADRIGSSLVAHTGVGPPSGLWIVLRGLTRGPPPDANPITRPAGRSLLYQLSVIRR